MLQLAQAEQVGMNTPCKGELDRLESLDKLVLEITQATNRSHKARPRSTVKLVLERTRGRKSPCKSELDTLDRPVFERSEASR
jgi:hypothetical protein